jgi:hypothetical protein
MFHWVHDIADYPVWLSLVHRVETDPSGTPATPAWLVELRARVGPLARSKRLRMVRTELIVNRRARFERCELDGRSHSAWVLQVDLAADAAATTAATRLDMTLHYGGGLWSGALLERVLHDEINSGRDRLRSLVESNESKPAAPDETD